ncbi:protein-tyrosine phosphatase-like protein [Aspergillus filifer]
MSATTGPRSPTSPWPQDSQSLTLPGPSSPAAFFPLSDPRPSTYNKISPREATAELQDSNYFSFNTDDPNNIRKHREHLTHALPHESPEGKFVTERDAAGQQIGLGSFATIPDAAVYRSSLNRSTERRESIPSGSKAIPAQTVGVSVSPVSTEKCAELVGSYADDLMLLDVRPFAHFSKGSIKRALNLCIPTTLLKRPSFDTKKLANTFTDESDRRNFGRWMQCRYIIVYDASTSNMRDALPLANVLKKFAAEGWGGTGMILMGGFKAFSSKFPQFTQQEQQRTSGTQSETTSPMHVDLPQSAPVAGGCNIPESSNAAIPFFGNIRQHMDLVGGVGQIALKLPEHLTESRRRSLPPWLHDVSDPADQGRIAASRFFEIEKTELERMKQALSYNQNKGNTLRSSSPGYRVAGIEKGTKNRYNDIYPFEHSRVKLHGIPHGACDYVNASYLKAALSNRHYIATQAPVPDTFNDFWRVVWEQDIRLVVSLTAEVERGQVKCHPFWKSGTYGPFYVKNFSKKYVPIGPSNVPGPQTGEGRSPVDSAEYPTLVIRHFGLSHSDFPFEPLREVTQIQYADWPDFGTTSQPKHLLDLIDQCDKVRTTIARAAPDSPQRPVLVHCSAGCGRTGTFCTVDSVLDVLDRQRQQPNGQHEGQSFDQLLGGGQLDLVTKTLSDFRTQRPSVVQNLSQFVLCYESILEWFVAQMPDSSN